MTTIGELSTMPEPKIYRRASGDLYLKLNDQFHVKTMLSDDKKLWLSDGSAEELDPDEQVEVVQ